MLKERWNSQPRNERMQRPGIQEQAWQRKEGDLLGIMQTTKIWLFWQMVVAEIRIYLGKWDTKFCWIWRWKADPFIHAKKTNLLVR